MQLNEIDLSDVEGFWTLPMSEREAAFATLRRDDPIRFFAEAEMELLPRGPGYWSITRHADVIEASRNPELFCSGMGYTIPDLPPEFSEFFGSMLSLDDPRHARLRKLVSAGFTPRMLAKVEADVHVAATSVVDNIIDKGSCDFVPEVAARLPLKIICDMMAIPESQYDFVFDQTNIILSQGDPEYIPEGADILEAFLTAGANLAMLMTEVADSRRGTQGDDLTTALVNAEIDGDRLTAEEIQSFFVLLCAAGNETTRTAVSWGLHYLTEHPDQRDRWSADYDTFAPTAVEEIVRMSSPVVHFRRTVTRDGARLGDHEFSEGEKIVLWYNSANRDAAVFDHPDTFDISRDPNNHVGFGGPGPHFCLGAHLARREITVLFRELLARLPDIHATAPPDRLRSNFINGVKHLPCAW